MFMCVFCNGEIVLDKVWCKMFNYSIIIPHKNIPSLLRRCLDSIPERNDLEIIVVDDNSDEETIKDLQAIHRNNLQIIYTKEGKGAGYARNIGLEQANSAWVIFADADDIFEPDFDTILNLLVSDKKSDIVNFDVTSRNSESNEANNEIEKIHYHCTDGKYLKDPMSFKFINLVPWGKAIRRDFVLQHHLQFEEIKHGNDLYFASLCDFYCQRRRIIPIVGYCWMYREESLWRNKNLEWAESRYHVLIKTGKMMKKLGEIEYGQRLIDGAWSFCISIKEYSYIKYLYTAIKYGIISRNYRILLINIPYFLFKDFFNYFFTKRKTFQVK